jgi:hypothetical protein
MNKNDIIEVEFSVSPIPEQTLRKMEEVSVRRDGCVWRVHKNDPDPFPSQPHAHNTESGLKMHLGTGRLYYRSTDTNKSIDRKMLLFIRTELTDKGISVPVLQV